MKTLIIAAVLAVAAVSTVSAESPAMTCRRPNGAACSADRVKALENAVKASTRTRPALANVKSLTVASGGALTCTQTNGAACTGEQMRQIQQVSSSLEMKLVVPAN